jgi:hypothetical protein
VQRINSIHTKQNIPSPISNKQLLINTTISDFMFDNYSEYQMSPSPSLFKQTNGKSMK